MPVVTLSQAIDEVTKKAEGPLSKEEILRRAAEILSATQRQRFEDPQLKEQFGLTEEKLEDQRKHDATITFGAEGSGKLG